VRLDRLPGDIGYEACDDQNEDNTDECIDDCQAARCGDGHALAGHEPCDDGNEVDTDACITGCILPTCGDGITHEGVEQCDDPTDLAEVVCRLDCTLIRRPVNFNQQFTRSQSSAGQCGAWRTFRSRIDAQQVYTEVRIFGSRSQSGVLCQGAAANTICQSLRAGTARTVACGGRTWRIGNCGTTGGSPGVELTTQTAICRCATGYCVRPCIGNSNWGGVNGATCTGDTQRMQVICQ
jgi:cysteine-rich repeat protein